MTKTGICRNATVTIYVSSPLPRISNFNLSSFEINKTIITPNPSDGEYEIFFNTELPENGNIEIYDVLGNTILSQNIEKRTTEAKIDIKNKSTGIYFLFSSMGHPRKIYQ